MNLFDLHPETSGVHSFLLNADKADFQARISADLLIRVDPRCLHPRHPRAILLLNADKTDFQTQISADLFLICADPRCLHPRHLRAIFLLVG